MKGRRFRRFSRFRRFRGRGSEGLEVQGLGCSGFRMFSV
jgi:hypothetical protein